VEEPFLPAIEYLWCEARQTEIHTAAPIVPKPSTFEFQMAFEKLKRHKSPSIAQIPAEWLKQLVEQIALRSINLLILFGIRKNCLRSGRVDHCTYLQEG